MDCDRARAELSAYLDDELQLLEKAALESHTASCEACAQALAAQRALSSALDALPGFEPSGDFEARFHARLARERELGARSRLRRVRGGFAILFGGALATAAALVLALRAPSTPTQAELTVQAAPAPTPEMPRVVATREPPLVGATDPDLTIAADEDDFELLAEDDADFELLKLVDVLEEWDGTPG